MSSDALKMSSTIDIQDINQEQANATPPGSPSGQGEEEEVEHSNQNKTANDGRQHQEEQLGWREWMVSLCRRAPAQERTYDLPVATNYTYWTDKRIYLTLCALAFITMFVIIPVTRSLLSNAESPSTSTRIMIYKKRFIRNLVQFWRIYCSNSDVTRFLYVLKSRLVSKWTVSHEELGE